MRLKKILTSRSLDREILDNSFRNSLAVSHCCKALNTTASGAKRAIKTHFNFLRHAKQGDFFAGGTFK